MKYRCEIHDRCEGVITYFVEADSEASAEDEAGIHAAEVGCRNVNEIVVFDDSYDAGDAFEQAARAHMQVVCPPGGNGVH